MAENNEETTPTEDRPDAGQPDQGAAPDAPPIIEFVNDRGDPFFCDPI